MDQQTSQYKCKLCSKSFNSEAELREHEKIAKAAQDRRAPNIMVSCTRRSGATPRSGAHSGGLSSVPSRLPPTL
jgi:hypothetical protein